MASPTITVELKREEARALLPEVKTQPRSKGVNAKLARAKLREALDFPQPTPPLQGPGLTREEAGRQPEGCGHPNCGKRDHDCKPFKDGRDPRLTREDGKKLERLADIIGAVHKPSADPDLHEDDARFLRQLSQRALASPGEGQELKRAKERQRHAERERNETEGALIRERQRAEGDRLNAERRIEGLTAQAASLKGEK